MHSEIDRLIGANIRRVRLARKMTQTKLGRVVAVSFQQVQIYENGQNRIPASTLFAFSGTLEVSISEFFRTNPEVR
ncbi:helix-turn-helix domain-containing protein [Bradyrhizobium sp. USDA 3397]